MNLLMVAFVSTLKMDYSRFKDPFLGVFCGAPRSGKSYCIKSMPKTIKVSSRDKLFHKSLLLTLVVNVPVTQYDPNFEEKL